MSDLNAYELALLNSEIASPDALDSPGALFLLGIQSAVDDYRRYADDPGQQIDDIGDMAHEIADGAVPIYTHERWQVFVELAAYQVDVAEISADSDDLTALAGNALYLVARDIAAALLTEDGEEE
jgi:hypothetical protein